MNQNPRLVEVIGFDPSMNNWGVAKGVVDPRDISTLKIHTLDVISIDVPTSKTVRQNSKDLLVSTGLHKAAYIHAKGVKLSFAEVPHGSQSARAMASYGICVGVLGSLRNSGFNFHEVTANEVKKVIGIDKPSKRDVIQWAYDRHPDAPWPFRKKGGESTIVESKANHMADAIVAIYAGFNTQSFKQALTFIS